ncbi:MAG: hypothetical protein AAF498_09200 [Pseudomonadota bacterium]
MRSFDRKASNRRQVFLALVGSIESQLREAYARKHELEGETQSSLAEKLGVNRSVVNRRLRGHANMTIESVADMVWALGHCIDVDIVDPTLSDTNRKQVIPTPSYKVLNAEIAKSSLPNRVTSSDSTMKTFSKPNSGLVVEAIG